MTTIPTHLAELLERPLICAVATIRPDNTTQVNPMWFGFDADTKTLRFVHGRDKAKFRNLQSNPSMSMTVFDPEKPLHYVEVRGRLSDVAPDPDGVYYRELGRRYYGRELDIPRDENRVVMTMAIEKVLGR